HRMACAIEDAGFEIRDQIQWIYGSGFPKSLDVSKAIDKAAGAEREVVSYDASRVRPNRLYEAGAIGNIGGSGKVSDRTDNGATITAPSTDAAKQWQGWGTALKPSHEPICVARKPLIGTVAANVLEHGTGALNIDGCRVVTTESTMRTIGAKRAEGWAFSSAAGSQCGSVVGRWPANLIHDGSDEVLEAFAQYGERGAAAPVTLRNGDKFRNSYGTFAGNRDEQGSTFQGDTGTAARFFYCAKASRSERGQDNKHPTVKPVALMQYLCRLVTPPGGTVLDPFAGSGTTGIAAAREGFSFVGIDSDPAHVELGHNRIYDDAPLFNGTGMRAQP
ncbi:MAG TPA: site-specific DNA-methyltransferase, partial [Edaphobacter sp.]|nr:site-specific DNA-methyltransferase [Edaphobacter sp.]